MIYLTVISGDCLLLSSSESRNVEVGNPGVEIAINDTIRYVGNIAKHYYLKVQAYTVSYYTVTLVVRRKSGSAAGSYDPDKVPLYLTEGISQLFSTDDRSDLRFYIDRVSNKKFFVQTSTNKGDITF